MSQDNNFSQGPVPQSARKGVLALTFVMLGLTFFSASMWTGGTLGTGLSYHDFFLAVLIGNLLLGIYTSFLGYIGAKTGLTTHLLARFSFGVKGSWLPSLKRRTKNAKAFHDKCENFSFRASNETAVLITAFYSLHGDHLGYG